MGSKKLKDVSDKGCGYDLESRGRCIEIKGFRNIRYPSITLYKKLKEQLKGKRKRYYIYVVYDIERKPKLKIIGPSVIWENYEEEKRYILRGKHYRRIPDEN